MYAIPQQGFPAGQNYQIVQQHQPYPGQPQPYGQVMQGGQFPAGFPQGGQAGGGFYQAAPVQVKSDDWLRGTEKAIRRDYDPLKKAWERRAVVLRVEKSPFASGSMRHAFKMEDLSLGETEGKGFVAKMSRTPATDRDIYFKDVEMQMEAKMWADRFNDKFGKKVVDFLVAYVAELVERPGAPLIGVEKMVDGNYVKYNNNWDWSDDRRNTPQVMFLVDREISNSHTKNPLKSPRCHQTVMLNHLDSTSIKSDPWYNRRLSATLLGRRANTRSWCATCRGWGTCGPTHRSIRPTAGATERATWG
jgi:hypothetical protein